MLQLQIQEFALNTSVEYQRPIPLDEAKLKEKANALVASSCGAFLDPTAISLSKQDDLFSYAMSVPMFNGAADVTINAQGITVSFKQGRTKEHLDLMINSTVTALETAKAAEIKRSVLAFNGHAVFDPPSKYAEYMNRFTSLGDNVISGGLVLVTALPEIEGQLRYASEKSLAYPDGLFFSANAVCSKEVNAELYQLFAKRLETTAALDQLSFKKT